MDVVVLVAVDAIAHSTADEHTKECNVLISCKCRAEFGRRHAVCFMNVGFEYLCAWVSSCAGCDRRRQRAGELQGADPGSSPSVTLWTAPISPPCAATHHALVELA